MLACAVSPSWYGSIFFSFNPFPNDFLDSSKLKEFTDDNSKFDENGGKFSKRRRKHCVKRRNCSLWAISPFPTVFSKDLHCKQLKNKGLFGEELNKKNLYISLPFLCYSGKSWVLFNLCKLGFFFIIIFTLPFSEMSRFRRNIEFHIKACFYYHHTVLPYLKPRFFHNLWKRICENIVGKGLKC